MINPTKEDIGKSVVYIVALRKYEYGIITSFNNQYVFVKYTGDNYSKATRREDLEW